MLKGRRRDFLECSLEEGHTEPRLLIGGSGEDRCVSVRRGSYFKGEESPDREDCFLKENIEEIEEDYSPKAQTEKRGIRVCW